MSGASAPVIPAGLTPRRRPMTRHVVASLIAAGAPAEIITCRAARWEDRYG